MQVQEQGRGQWVHTLNFLSHQRYWFCTQLCLDWGEWAKWMEQDPILTKTQQENHGVGLAPSTWPQGQPVRGARDALHLCVSVCVYMCEVVRAGLRGRKHLLTEGSQEVLRCMCLYVCTHACSFAFVCVCAQPRVYVSIKAKCLAFPPVSGRPGRGPPSSGAQTETPCSFL